MFACAAEAYLLKSSLSSRRSDRLVPYLPDLYRELCDPGYAADHIIGLAKTGDAQVLRLGLSDLITALSMTKPT